MKILTAALAGAQLLPQMPMNLPSHPRVWIGKSRLPGLPVAPMILSLHQPAPAPAQSREASPALASLRRAVASGEKRGAEALEDAFDGPKVKQKERRSVPAYTLPEDDLLKEIGIPAH